MGVQQGAARREDLSDLARPLLEFIGVPARGWRLNAIASPLVAVVGRAGEQLIGRAMKNHYPDQHTRMTGIAAGAGVRWVTTSQCVNSVSIGPGVDVLFHLNDGQAVMIAPTVDVAWRRNFGDRAAFLLGLTAGIGVGLSGREDDDDGKPVSGQVTPLIGVFTGLRY